MNNKRAFISLSLPTRTLDETAKFQKVIRSIDKVKIIPKQNIHLTLEFLGELGSNELDAINKILIELGSKYSKFEANIADYMFFPDPKKPRVITLSIDSKGIIEQIQAELHQALAKELDLVLESRAFTAHITIARVLTNKFKSSDLSTIINSKPEAEMFNVSEIQLIESTLKDTGPVYKLVKSVKLSK